MTQSPIVQANLVKEFRLVLEAFDGDVVDGLFEEFLARGCILRENATGEDDLCEMLAEVFEVEGDLVFDFGGSVESVNVRDGAVFRVGELDLGLLYL